LSRVKIYVISGGALAVTAPALLALVLLVQLGRVSAQVPPGAGSEVLSETVHASYTCGASKGVAMKSGVEQVTTMPGTVWVDMPDAWVNLPVSQGNADCILVTATAVGYTTDIPQSQVTTCYLRAVVAGATMFPRGDFNWHSRSSDIHFSEPRSLQWMYRLTPSVSIVKVYLQWRVQQADDLCVNMRWTLVAERFE
jgi:hypothetical protein